MKVIIKKTVLLIIFSAVTIPAAAGFVTRGNVTTKIFYSESDLSGWNAVIRGRVDSLGTRDVSPTELHQAASGRSKITMILDNADGLMTGDELYIINENHLIVARLTLVSILKSVSFGHIGVGYGNFRRVKKNYLVVQKVTESDTKYAYIYKTRGDYFRNTGDMSQAILQYEKALSYNSNHPESHLALGEIYLNKNMIDYAEKEFRLAYAGKGYVYDNEDRYRIYRNILNICRYRVLKDDTISGKTREGYIAEGLKVAKEARNVFPDDVEVYYDIGLFAFHSKMDIESKNALLTVISQKPDHIDSLLILARLYHRHNNREKSVEFVERVLTVEPDNALARDLYEEYNR